MNSSKKYIICIIMACLIAIFTNKVNAQSSVTLSNLLVTNHFTGGPDVKKIAIKLDVTGIDNLVMLQIELSETADYKDIQTIPLEIAHKDGKHFIRYAIDNNLPISGKPQVIFFIDVRDQLRTPYHYIRITGTDSMGQKSNTVQFIKK